MLAIGFHKAALARGATQYGSQAFLSTLGQSWWKHRRRMTSSRSCWTKPLKPMLVMMGHLGNQRNGSSTQAGTTGIEGSATEAEYTGQLQTRPDPVGYWKQKLDVVKLLEGTHDLRALTAFKRSVGTRMKKES
eukprot:3118253-Amphidinium_carterae.1